MGLKSKPHRSIKARLFLPLLVLFLPVFLLEAYFYYDRFANRRAQELQANLEFARAVGAAFNGLVQDILRQELAIAAAATALPPPSTPVLSLLLLQRGEDRYRMHRFSWVGPDGRVVASGDPQLVGADISDTQYYKEIVSGREWVVGDLVLSKASREPIFTISRSVRDEKGALLGLVVSTVQADRLEEILAVKRANDARVALIDRKGMLVATYPPKEFTWEERNWLKLYPGKIESALKGEETTSTVTLSTGKKRLVGVTPIPSIGWAASASQSEDDVMAPVLSDLHTQAALFLFLTFAAFGTALALSRPISTSIVELRNRALALGRGETENLAVVPGSTRELNELTQAFDKMAGEVRNREDALRREIAERKRAEEELRVSEARYRSIFENSLDGIFLTAPDGQVLAANPAACTMHGYTEDEIRRIGRDGIVDTGDPRLQEIVTGRSRHGRYRGEDCHIRKDGTRFSCEISTARFRDAQGRESNVVIIRDITERRLAEEALRRAKDELELRVRERTAELKERAEQLARLSSQLTLSEQRERRRLAVIIHDHLQQLLVGAKIRLELLISRLSATDRKDVEPIFKLVVDSLKTARSLNTQLSPDILYERGLGPALKWLAQTMQETYQLSVATQIDTRITVGPENIKVLLFESARELLFNVVKHARTTSASMSMFQDDTESLHITVSDQGVGFDPKKRLKDIGENNRFGLFSIRERLELIGGDLEIETSPGHGAVIHIIVPLDKIMSCENTSPLALAPALP
jgi:PAS domain S-box-containing protein